MNRTILGHSHNPKIAKGVYAVGSSVALDLQYATGPAEWGAQRHIVIRPKLPLTRRRELVEHSRRLHGR